MTKHGLNYLSQDRGNSDKYNKYLKGMDSVIVEKIASASAYIPHRTGYTIVDVGMASGTGTYILAVLFPNCKVIGIDINPTMVDIASATYQLPNLSFMVDDGEKLENLNKNRIIGFFNCSSIHHITSFNDYNPHRAYLTIKRQYELLEEGGVVVIRDFVKPDEREVIIDFPETEQGQFDCNLLEKFAKTARSLSLDDERGFPLKAIDANKYQLSFSEALEFVRRKNYLDDWDVELQEEYGYYSQNDFETVFSDLGFRIICSSPIYNSWIIENRYKSNFELSELNGDAIGFPATNYIVAGEKVSGKGVRIKEVRQLALLQEGFIRLQAYQNKQSKAIYDVAQRPLPVIDILPYYFDESGQVNVLAKHGYPRPIVNQAKVGSIIDEKSYSGYLTEAITAMKDSDSDLDAITKLLTQRVGMKSQHIKQVRKSLRYFTSPGGIDEVVDAYFVEIDQPKLNASQSLGFSSFKDDGQVRSYNLVQLVKSIQVGAIPDVRLELNCYDLLSLLQVDKETWLNNKLSVPVIDKIQGTDLNEILMQESRSLFEPIDHSAGFLSHYRAKFYEYKREDSSAVFEYIIPSKLSFNTVVTLPVFESKGELYIGIEMRDLPVPQLHENNSSFLAAPAFRLPQTVRNYNDLELFILKQELGNAKVVNTSQLGEKYLPCTGITPEQVYLYVVELDKASDALLWVKFKELMNSRAFLRDGHLLASLFRLDHALYNK